MVGFVDSLGGLGAFNFSESPDNNVVRKGRAKGRGLFSATKLLEKVGMLDLLPIPSGVGFSDPGWIFWVL